MLFKRSSPTARDARFATIPERVDRVGADPELSLAPSPSPEQVEIERLNKEIASLSGELKRIRDGWDSALADAESRAKELAKREHVRDDEAIRSLLRQELAAARENFERKLDEEASPLAEGLAKDALARLVEPRLEESEWLLRSIARRLAALRSEAVVAIHLAPPDHNEAILGPLRTQLPPGIAIVADPELKAGSAHIALHLGRIEIDPSAGLAAVLAQLDDLGDG